MLSFVKSDSGQLFALTSTEMVRVVPDITDDQLITIVIEDSQRLSKATVKTCLPSQNAVVAAPLVTLNSRWATGQ